MKPRDVLVRSTTELVELCGTSIADVKILVDAAAKTLAPEATTAESLRKKHVQSRLCSGLPQLDDALGGGLPAAVCEVVGTAGSAKTQLCILIACSAASIGKRVVYIDAEGKLSAQRLAQVASFACGSNETYEDVVKRITLCKPQNTRECIETIKESPSASPALLVLDSAAALPRQDFDSSQLNERMHSIAELSATLVSMASQLYCPVITVNQVAESLSSTGSHERELLPALGSAWSHAASTRIALDNGMLAVVTSAQCAPIAWRFSIGEQGLWIAPNSSVALPPECGASLRLSPSTASSLGA